MTSKKPYFPHNIDAVMDTEYNPVEFDVVMDNTSLWEIPSSVCVIMRAEHKQTGKVKEYSYQSTAHARNRLEKLLINGEYKVTIVDDMQVVQLNPEYLEE